MKTTILIGVIVSVILLGIISTVSKASNKDQLQQVDLKTKSQEIQIKTQKSEELQKRLEDAQGDLDKLKEIEKENKKLQDDIKALQAKKAEKARLAALEKKSLAERTLNAVTRTQTVQASTGSCADWMAQAGVPNTTAANALIGGESGCNPYATNPSSGAYGIPQSLPAHKMASAGPDWRTNPVTQLRWMAQYIKDRYGSWENAYNTWLSRSPHWY